MEIIYTILCIACLCMGFFYGYKIGKREKIETPVEKVKEIKVKRRETREEKEAREKLEAEIEKLNIAWDNVNNYPDNQKEVE